MGEPTTPAYRQAGQPENRFAGVFGHPLLEIRRGVCYAALIN